MFQESDSIFPHGGDLSLATKKFGLPPGGWLDLSTGINPRPYPLPPLPAETMTRLPDRHSHNVHLPPDFLTRPGDTPKELRSVAVVRGPGSELLIRLLPHAIPKARKAAIVGPTYSSHAEAWASAGRTVVEIADIGDLPGDADVLVLCNPNNPDGRRTDPESLVPVATALAARGGILVVDEAFADVAPELSFGPFLRLAPALVLRSFGKFFGLPGLRVGLAAGALQIAGDPLGALRSMLGSWSLSGPALAVAHVATSDREWIEDTRRYLRAAATRLRSSLERAGLEIVGGTDLFVLVRHPEARALHAALARKGIWTRAFSYRADWIRFGLPPTDRFDQLDRALGEIGREGLRPLEPGPRLVT